jgi:CRP-like cAMP-binding protein
MIDKKIIEKYSPKIKILKKDTILFKEGSSAINYYQIITGEIKMCNFNDDGKEFVQGFFYDNQSFGEPPLFLDAPYPANAVTLRETTLYCLPKEVFFKILKENPEIVIETITNLSQRMRYKAIMMAEISFQEPEHRLLKLIEYIIAHFKLKKGENGYKIDFTRQQMADLTGLRVETVIRTIKTLEKKGTIKIINRKVYL